MKLHGILAAMLGATLLVSCGTDTADTGPDTGLVDEAPATGLLPDTGPSPATPEHTDSWTGGSLIGRSASDLRVEVVTDRLRYPWEVRSVGRRLVVTEAEGNIVTIDGTGVHRARVATSRPVAHDGGSGLLGLDLAPDFETSGTAWAFYTYRDGAGLTNRVVELEHDSGTWTETRVLLDELPGHELYNGGRVALGPDGHLYVTTGWAHDLERPRDPDDLGGKILRMDLNGRAPSDNPTAGSIVYSLGHRNPQGLAWDPQGRLFSAEHGESGNDEINVIDPGGDYGWPDFEGDDAGGGTVSPFLNSGPDAWAPSGVAFAGDELLVSSLGDEVLYVLDPTAARRVLEPLFSSDERVRTVLAVGNSLYLTTTNTSPRADGPSGDSDRLLRLSLRN